MPLPQRPFFAHPAYRTVSGLFGLVLLGCAGWVLLEASLPPLGRLGGGLFLLALASNHLWCAWARREPWLSKIGPLP